jgi:DNA-binding transcriptional MerR regulator
MPARKPAVGPIRYRTQEVARVVGISSRTLLRKLQSGELPEPDRNPDNNYRLWTLSDIEVIQQILKEKR